MKTRMNKVRLLAGGMAAIITMSSMSTIAFAAEAYEIPNEVQAEYNSTWWKGHGNRDLLIFQYK